MGQQRTAGVETLSMSQKVTEVHRYLAAASDGPNVTEKKREKLELMMPFRA
jgi:hypothetical protein